MNQYTGDGIMALFGAPIAHEDHAQRACYAALHMRDALRELAREVKRQPRASSFATRIGINSGEVVVGKIGDDLRMDYTAHGHTVGLAQRMEALASAGSIYRPHRRLRWSRLLRARGPGRVRGEGRRRRQCASSSSRARDGCGRTSICRAHAGSPASSGAPRICARSRMRSNRRRPETGRWSAWWRTRESGRAGSASSSSSAAAPAGCASYEGRAVAHGRSIPFLPIARGVPRLLRHRAHDDDDRSAREKIAGRLVALDQELGRGSCRCSSTSSASAIPSARRHSSRRRCASAS